MFQADHTHIQSPVKHLERFPEIAVNYLAGF